MRRTTIEGDSCCELKGIARFVRPGKMPTNGLKIRCPLTKSAALPNGKHRSIKGPISVPVSPSNAVKCYPCREVPLNYNRSLLFHGGDTGSTPVRDAKLPKHFCDLCQHRAVEAFLNGLFPGRFWM